MRGLNDGGASPSTDPAASSSYGSLAILQNYPLISAFAAFAIAQLIKFFTSWYKEKRWDAKQLIGSGGMPSSHSATVTALAVSIGFQDGFGGSIFATSMILACVVSNSTFLTELHLYALIGFLINLQYVSPYCRVFCVRKYCRTPI
ncbi:uncharacterized protein LOC109824443 [Asparagus officinalis]|uniref:uncharacterized protein LOC109824443 n=1 Tax=Asparagus officinalis TaxID=4686 RepID=UPI00098DE542|nr:uncharacterized protein LOC109824443 [Asparagus officinalis]